MLAPTIIKPPSTNAKDALPTESIYDDAQRIFSLIEDERHMSALSLYTSVMERLNPSAPLSNNNSPNKKLHFRRTPTNIFKRPKKDKASDAEEQARGLIEQKKKDLESLEVGPECETEEELCLLSLYHYLRHVHPIPIHCFSGTLQHVSKGQAKFGGRRRLDICANFVWCDDVLSTGGGRFSEHQNGRSLRGHVLV
jgi:hypothetical protein